MSSSHNPKSFSGTRLCRFSFDGGIPLLGFYEDDYVIPIDEAAVAHADVEESAPSPATDDLLELLPPKGSFHAGAVQLAHWIRHSPDAPTLDELSIPTSDITLLTPLPHPGKILLLAGNYAAHIEEQGGIASQRAETFPYVFMKPNTCLTNPFDPIVIPHVSPDHIDWECELGIVIGRTCRDVPESRALSYVAGYTVVNDISDRKFQPNPNRKPRDRDKFFDWQHGKWHDTFLPVGPCILSAQAAPDPQSLTIRLTVNGQIKQHGSTAQMIFPVAALVSFLSTLMTLHPGDLIATGTPSGVGHASGTYLKPGDKIVAEVEGIGQLSNPVIVDR